MSLTIRASRESRLAKYFVSSKLSPSMNKNTWNAQIDLVRDILLDTFGFEVVFLSGESDRVDLEERVIYINSRCHPETKFYTLLHEYGHVELTELGADALSIAVPSYKSFHATRSSRSNSGKIATIVEEIEAWKRGRLLALREGMHISVKKYEKHMNDALMSYILWAAGA